MTIDQAFAGIDRAYDRGYDDGWSDAVDDMHEHYLVLRRPSTLLADLLDSAAADRLRRWLEHRRGPNPHRHTWRSCPDDE